MADSLRSFSTRCLSAGRLADVQAFAATKAVTVDLTADVRASIKAAAPNLAVKNRKGKPIKIGAGYRIDPVKNSGFVFARGPLQIIERDTKAHGEPRQLKRPSRRPKAKLRRSESGALEIVVNRRKMIWIPRLRIARRSVKHPGTKGRHPFTNAVDEYAASGKASKTYASHMNRVLKKVAQE